MASTSKVPSPMHQALSELYSSIQKDQPTMANALKDTCQRMAGGDVWIGYAADSWDSELTGRSADLMSNINATVADIQQQLAATPATCTPEEARFENMIISGRLQ
jgi:uncharacterized protein YukE